jgi:hypothetical protein
MTIKIRKKRAQFLPTVLPIVVCVKPGLEDNSDVLMIYL